MKRKCVVCNKQTENWQRVNGSAWHCYDGCYSTTGIDNRTINGGPLWEGNKTKPEYRHFSS
jgi:hypothetical protein